MISLCSVVLPVFQPSPVKSSPAFLAVMEARPQTTNHSAWSLGAEICFVRSSRGNIISFISRFFAGRISLLVLLQVYIISVTQNVCNERHHKS